MQKVLSVTSVVLWVLGALAGSVSADPLVVTGDHAFIDNRPTVATAGYDDPLLTGLNLNLDVTVTDSVGGTAALSAGTATFTSSNPAYNLSTTMSFDPVRSSFGATPPGVTSADFSKLQGTFTFTITDANGTVMDTSHPLDFLVVLDFPTVGFSDHSTTPTVTLIDPNPSPPAGITRAYDLRIVDPATWTTSSVSRPN